MNIYILDYWVPYPESEYQGQVIAIAKDKKQLKRLLQCYKVGHAEKLTDSIKNAIFYKLEDSESVQPSVIKIDPTVSKL